MQNIEMFNDKINYWWTYYYLWTVWDKRTVKCKQHFSPENYFEQFKKHFLNFASESLSTETTSEFCLATINPTNSPTRTTKTSMAHFITLVLATRQFLGAYNIAVVILVYTTFLIAFVSPTFSFLCAFALT